jgi:hypothetical protein
VDRIYCLVRVRGGGLMTRCVHKAAVRARELMSEATAKFHRIADRTGIPAALIKAQGLGANDHHGPRHRSGERLSDVGSHWQINP